LPSKASKRQAAASENARAPSVELAALSRDALDELARRVQDIHSSHRSVAQKMGQLYICADENNVMSLTAALDQPMRNASESEQTFAAILEQLRVHSSLRR